LFSPRPAATGRRRAQTPRRPHRPPRPRLEWLEDRITPTTFTPTELSDGVSGGAVNTLRDAVLAANNDTGTATDTIRLAAGTYTLSIANSGGHDTTGTEGDLNIANTNRTLVIRGATDANGKPATAIDQTVADRVFQVVDSGTTVLFQNLIIEGGDAQENGGFLMAGSSSALGGGILDDGSNVTLDNVVLQNNQAQAGPGENAEGGGIYVDSGALTINDSVIKNNRASGGAGTATTPSGSYAYGGGVAFDDFSGPNPQLSITNSTVANNLALGGNGFALPPGAGGSARGGGINTSGGSNLLISITASTLTGNRAVGGDGAGGAGFPGSAEGGGANLQGTSNLVNATIAGNEAVAGNGLARSDIFAFGGGVSFGHGWVATLTNVTVAGNTAGAARGGAGTTTGGGIDNHFAPVTLTNTLVALNSAATGPDYNGSVSKSDHNLIGKADGSSGFSAANGDRLGTTASPVKPLLGPLANNGGPTQTIALLPGSPAIDAGDNNALSITGPNDQRGAGFPRVVGGAIDIGAFEVPPPSPLPPPPSPPPSPPPPASGGGSSSSSSTQQQEQPFLDLLIELFFLEVILGGQLSF
jgi:hypothetical protein